MAELDGDILDLTNRRRFKDALEIEQGLLASAPGDIALKAPTPKETVQPPSIPRAVSNAFMRGTFGLGATVGGVTAYTGNILGSETIQDWGQTAADFWTQAAESLPARDKRKLMDDPSVLISPGWWAENLAEATPGFAAFLIPSLAAGRMVSIAGKAMQLTPELIGRLAYIGTKVASPAMFGAMELGGTYNEVKARGGSDEDAVAVATQAGLIGAALGAINLHYIMGEGGGLMRRAGRGAVSTSLISFLAEGTRGAVLGDDVWDTLRNAVNSMPTMAVLGGAAGAALGKPGAKEAKPAGEPTKVEAPPVDPRLEQLRQDFQAGVKKIGEQRVAEGQAKEAESFEVLRQKVEETVQQWQDEGRREDETAKLKSDFQQSAAEARQAEAVPPEQQTPEQSKAVVTTEKIRKSSPLLLDLTALLLEKNTVPANMRYYLLNAFNDLLAQHPEADLSRGLMEQPHLIPDAMAAWQKAKNPPVITAKAGEGEPPTEPPKPPPPEAPTGTEPTEKPVSIPSAEAEPAPTEAEVALSDWQQAMKEQSERIAKTPPAPPVPPPEPPAAPPADEVPASDLWPGMKSVRVSEQARPILEGLQADAVAEAGRLTQKRGVQTDAETAAKAGKLIQDGTFTLDHILEAKPGTTWNAEEGHAAISILQALGNRVAKLAEMSLKESSGVSPEQFKDAYGVLETAAQAVSAVATETGRQLRSLRTDITKETAPPWVLSLPELQYGGNLPPNHPFFSERPISLQEILTRGRAFGQGVSARFLAEQIAGLPTAGKQAELLGLWTRLGRAGMDLFYGSILTPLSAARNAIAIPATVGYYLGTVKAAEYIRRVGTWIAPDKVDAARGIVQGSSGAAWAGLQTGLQDAWALISKSYEAASNVRKAEGMTKGLQAFESAIRNEAGKLGPMTLEKMNRPLGISAEAFPELNEVMGKLVDVAGLVTTLPGITGLSAGDIVSKIVNDRIGVSMKAHQIASAQGLTGGAFEAEVARLIKERPPEVDKAGTDLANKNTFTGEEGLIGKFARGMSHPLARIFVSPFVRTPLRIVEYTLEGTPILQNLTRGWWQDVRSADPARRDLALAKMAVGWSMMVVVGGLAANGIVTGVGPRDPQERKRWQETGWQPNSIRIGDQYISIAGMEPFSSWLGMFADFVHIAARLPDESIGTLLPVLAIAAGDNLMTKRYVQGFSDWITALSANNMEQRLEAIQNRLALPLPWQGILGIARKEVDPQVKDARGLLDRYARSVPGWSESVAPLRNIITGEAQTYQGAWGPDWISPFFTSTQKQDAVLDEIVRLKGAGLRAVPDVIGGAEQPSIVMQEPLKPWGVSLSSQQRDRWIILMTQEIKPGGKTLHDSLVAVMGRSDYAGQSDLGKQVRIQSVYDDYKRAGQAALIRGDTKLRREVALAQGERQIAAMPVASQAFARERLLSTLGR